MKADDSRVAERRIILKPARASDLTGKFVVNCIVRDASKTGCMIVSNQIGELGKEILLEVTGVKGSRKGLVVWRDKKTAGVRFV